MAGLTNGNFESGDLTGWITSGDVSIKQASFGSGPTQGIYQVLLNSGENKAELKQHFTANEGDIFSFDWNFLTNEGTPQWQGNNDKAYVLLAYDPPDCYDPHTLADTWSYFINSATIFEKETGFNTFSVRIPAAGLYIVSFGVKTTGDDLYASALLIDNVNCNPADSTSNLATPTNFVVKM